MVALKRSCLVAVLLAAVVVSLTATATAGAAVGGSSTVVKHFDDPRNDWPSRPGTIEIVRYGPFNVPAASEDEPGMLPLLSQLAFNLPAPCSNCYITDLVPSLVYADGTDSNFDTGTMLHHFVLFNPAEQDATCPNGFFGTFNLGDRFFASGSERSHAHLPDGYGYYNTSGAWTLIADLMNMMPEPQEVYVQVVVRHRPARAELNPVKPIWLDINNCGTSEYSIPSGDSDAHWSWTSNLSGYIVGIGGHQHDLSAMEMECMADASLCPNHGGGVAISAELVGGPRGAWYGPKPPTGGLPADLTGSTICRSEDRYYTEFGNANGFMGHLDTMTACGLGSALAGDNEAYPWRGSYSGNGFPIEAGQTIRLHSQYTNPGDPRSDVMGIMLAYLHETAVD